MNLCINASTGTKIDPCELREDCIEVKISETDYLEVVILELEGRYGNYHVKAEMYDKVFLLQVNPFSGRQPRLN